MRPSLAASLSQLLIAFTVEVDNEVERRLPHRTTRGPAAQQRGPWLVSLPMWSNLLRWLPDEVPTPPTEIADLIPLVNLPGLQRRGYVRTEGAAVTLTRAGAAARAAWAAAVTEVEREWRLRFGSQAVDALIDALVALPLPSSLPWYLPVRGLARQRGTLPTVRARSADADLATLLSRALMTYTADYEERSRLSLAISANVLRVLTPDRVPARVLPLLAGVSREQCGQSVGLLERVECVTVTRASRSVVVTLTERGRMGQLKYAHLTTEVEALRRKRFGRQAVDQLTEALSAVLRATADDRHPLLAEGLEPYPDGWRANPPYRALTEAILADPLARLAHHPIVSHRGGFPDGS